MLVHYTGLAQLSKDLNVLILFISLDLNTNLFLVQDGVVAPILKTPILSSMIPPIEPYIKDLKFKFNATGMVRTLKIKPVSKGLLNWILPVGVQLLLMTG